MTYLARNVSVNKSRSRVRTEKEHLVRRAPMQNAGISPFFLRTRVLATMVSYTFFLCLSPPLPVPSLPRAATFPHFTPAGIRYHLPSFARFARPL